MREEQIIIPIPPVETHISKDIYEELRNIILKEVNNCKYPDDIMKPYVYPIENIQKISESDNIEYKENIRTMADELWGQNDWLNAIILYYILMHVISFVPTDFYKLGYSLAKLKYNDTAQRFIDIYESVSINKKVTCHAIANFYYTATDSPIMAMKYFEKYLEFDPENANIYNTLSHIYSRIDDKISKEKQMKALLKAYELKPEDPVIVKSLLTAYEKQHNEEKVKEFYPKLIELAHSPRHAMNYGLYLISWGQFQEGGKYFSERFDLEKYPIGYPKGILNMSNKWNLKDDISDKVLVVHYEEGFGDTIMYSRFLPIIKQFAQKTAFIIQPELMNLFKKMFKYTDGIDIFSDIKDFVSVYKNENYVHVPLLDLPYVLGIESDFIPYTDKYIIPAKPIVFDKTKFNIGIAYSGDIEANYSGRDIGPDKFVNIAKLNNVQLYSLQVGIASEQLKDLAEDVSIIDSGKGFNDFTDTANTIAGLDMVVTTDNVILNLAGAMGKKTFGIFNRYPNYRWFNLSGNNVRWYDSVKPFQCSEENAWEDVMKSVESEIGDLIKARNNNEG